MDLDQFRRIYADYQLAEARTLSSQYKSWDYSAQHSLMRSPLDKRQYDPTKDKAEELYHREEKFVQMVQPKARLSHLAPGISVGLTSRLAGKDFRDTSAKFATYGELFNHIDMVPDVANIVKQMLTPLQTQMFIESINSINANEKSPGLLLSTTFIDFVKKMTSSLISTKDALENNHRRLYKDSLNRLEILSKDQSYRILPSKAAEILSRLTDLVLTLNNEKQDDFDEEETAVAIPNIRRNATRDAEDVLLQNQLNNENITRAQTQLGAIVSRQEMEQQIEGITGQDYAQGASLLLNMYSDLLDQVTGITETPMPLKSQASSYTKTSTVKTINTDTKGTIANKEESLVDLLRKVLEKDKRETAAKEAAKDGVKPPEDDEEDDDDEDGGDEQTVPTAIPAPEAAPPAAPPAAPEAPTAPAPPPAQPAAPPRTTPQGPTLIVPNNPTMVPTQPTPAQQVPLFDEWGLPIGGPTVTQAIAPVQEPPIQEQTIPPITQEQTIAPTLPVIPQQTPPQAEVQQTPTQTATQKQVPTATEAVKVKKSEEDEKMKELQNMREDETRDLDELFISLPWPRQFPTLQKIKDEDLSAMVMWQKNATFLSEDEGGNFSIFYVDQPSRTKLYKVLRDLNITQRLNFTRKGLRKSETEQQLYEIVTSALKQETQAKPIIDQSSSGLIQGSWNPIQVTPAGVVSLSKPAVVVPSFVRNETGRLQRAKGKPRGRGRPKKREREEIVDTEDSKKARVQLPSLLSSFALPAQVSSSPDILDLHKDDIVTSITVKRSPIPQFMEDLFESLSNGTWSQLKKKHGFDSFFHLAAVINDDILIEKNSNGINVAIYKPYESEEIKVPAKLLGKFTLGEMVEKVKSDMGQDFYSYHPFENNCQNFMFRFLKDSKALTPQIAEFVSQPIDNLVKDLPSYFSPLVKAAADVYGVVQPMLNSDA